MNKDQRVFFLDALRGFGFLLMAFDHTIHGYAQKSGTYWFFQDSERSNILDGVYLFNNSVIIPLIFFVIGLFVYPGYDAYGPKKYILNRFTKYLIPFIVGPLFVVPLLMYPKYQDQLPVTIGYLDYWKNIYFSKELQAGPFWVMLSLALYTGILILFRPLFTKLNSLVKFFIKNPILGLICFGTLNAMILMIFDLLYGAPWWIGFGRVFYWQGSRFAHQFLFFLLGGVIGSLPKKNQTDLWKKIMEKFYMWTFFLLIIGGGYIWFTLTNYQKTYDDTLMYLIKQGHLFDTVFGQYFYKIAPWRVARTVLHGFFVLIQIMFFLSLFRRFFYKETKFWRFLALNCWGLFILHESMVVWGQFLFKGVSLPVIIKILVIFPIASIISLLLTNIFKKNKYLNSVF